MRHDENRVGIVAVALAATLGGCGRGTSAPPGSSSAGTVAAREYVGSQRCAECHGSDLPAAFHGTYEEDWLSSAHGQSSDVAPSEQRIVADMDRNGSTDFADGVDLGALLAFQPYTVAGGAPADLAPLLGRDAQGRYTVTLGDRVFVVEKVLGVGRHRQAFLTRIGNSRYVLPMVYDVDLLTWEPLLGENWYEFQDLDQNAYRDPGEAILGLRYASGADTPASAGRTRDSFEASCAGCHVTGIRSLQRNGSGEYLLDFLEDGVGCEACHGPGSVHSELAGGDPVQSNIVDPGELSPDLHRDLCMSCHTRGTSTGKLAGHALEFPWHGSGRAFLPGESLRDSFTAAPREREQVHPLQGTVLHEGSTYGTWAQDCQDCHSAHNTLNLSLVRMVTDTPVGYRHTRYAAAAGPPGSPGLMGDALDGNFTDACEVCHTQTRYFRNDSSTPATEHFNGQDCTQCHSHANGFHPVGGVATGGVDCAVCHGTLVAAMDAATPAFRHVLGDTDPAYPIAGSPLECLSCHVDHDVFSPADAASRRAFNLRTDIDVLPGASSGFTNTDFDFALGGGICMSCHDVPRTKADPRPDGSTTTPAIPFAGTHDALVSAYDQGVHGGSYAVLSSFSDGTSFVADCSKCHNDDLAPKSGVSGQNSFDVFGLHRSLHAGMLAPLGASSAGGVLEEEFCYRCHSRVNDAIGGTRKTIAGYDWYESQPLSARSEGAWATQQLAFGHRVEASSGVHTSFEGTSPGWMPAGNRHVECDDCHNPHATGPARSFFFDGTFLQPLAPGNLAAGTPLGGVWGVDVPAWPGEWTAPSGAAYARRETSTYTWQVCLKCHSAYAYGAAPPAGQTDQGLEFNPNNTGYHAVLGASVTDTGSGSAFVSPWTRTSLMSCEDCHTTADPGGAQGPHGSMHGGILAGAYDSSTGQSGTGDHLCFKCHSFSVYGRGGNSSGSNTGFSNGSDNLHTKHASEDHYAQNRKCTCFDCHAAVPHGFPRRAMLVVQEDPAPYNNGSAGNRAADVPNWPAPGNWKENSCSTTPCHD